MCAVCASGGGSSGGGAVCGGGWRVLSVWCGDRDLQDFCPL